MRRVRSRIFAGMPLQANSANLRSLQLMDSTGLVPRLQPPTARFGLANPEKRPGIEGFILAGHRLPESRRHADLRGVISPKPVSGPRDETLKGVQDYCRDDTPGIGTK